MKKKSIVSFITIALIFVAMFSLSACQKSLYVTYTASEGGRIVGQVNQTVEYGGNTETVTAIPDESFAFIKWSDGNLNATRTDENIISSFSVTAEFKKIKCDVNYYAGTGGSITGQVTQTVEYGGSGSSVTAEANEGYRFIKWSDGNLNATRTDENIITSFSVTAEFERVVKAFDLIYNNATENNTQTDIILYRGKLENAEFITPQKRAFHF